MQAVRAVILLLLLTAAGAFVLFVLTGQARYKWFGLRTLKWTLTAAAFFFAVLILERVV